MFSKVQAPQKDFLDKTKAAREERHNERNKDVSAIKIQVVFVGFIKFLNLVYS